MNTADISITNLAIGLCLLLIPIGVHLYYNTGQTKSIILSAIRMVVQLFLVGIYLKYLFIWNNTWINTAWLLIMVGVCSIEMIGRVELNKKIFLPCVYVSILFAVFVVITYFLRFVVEIDYLFESRYFIPMCGSLMGNILGSNVIGLNSLFQGLNTGERHYYYMLCNGASCEEATRPFIRTALRTAFAPTIASMAVMGLISMPGTLVGQILGGSSPDVAIRYQIMIIVLHLVCSTISIVLVLNIAIRQSLDGFGLLRPEAFTEKKKSKT